MSIQLEKTTRERKKNGTLQDRRPNQYYNSSSSSSTSSPSSQQQQQQQNEETSLYQKYRMECELYRTQYNMPISIITFTVVWIYYIGLCMDLAYFSGSVPGTGFLGAIAFPALSAIYISRWKHMSRSSLAFVAFAVCSFISLVVYLVFFAFAMIIIMDCNNEDKRASDPAFAQKCDDNRVITIIAVVFSSVMTVYWLALVIIAGIGWSKSKNFEEVSYVVKKDYREVKEIILEHFDEVKDFLDKKGYTKR